MYNIWCQVEPKDTLLFEKECLFETECAISGLPNLRSATGLKFCVE
jgi:hypothetical protein